MGTMNHASRNPVDAYVTNAVMTAGPVKLVVLLLDGAVGAVDRGCRCVESGDAPGARAAFMKAWDIVAELRATLDAERGGPVAGDLYALWSFTLTKLGEAKIDADVAKAREARGVLATVREGFQGILHAGN